MADARCTCGYTKFAERVDRTRERAAVRWRLIGAGGGMGATSFGTSMGTAEMSSWGRFAINVVTGVRNTVCLSCARIRRGLPVGGGIAMASWVEGKVIYALMTDVVDPACIEARFSLDSGAHLEADVRVQPAAVTTIPRLPGTPLEQRDAPPRGAVTPSLVYRVEVPTQIDEGGLYRLSFLDRCLGTSQRIIELELVAGVLTAYTRTGVVTAQLGDYAASQVPLQGPYSVKDWLEAAASELSARVGLAGDLGGANPSPQVQGLRGRPVSDLAPIPDAQLVWSSTNQRWEIEP